MSPKAKLLFRKANPEFKRELLESITDRADYQEAKQLMKFDGFYLETGKDVTFD